MARVLFDSLLELHGRPSFQKDTEGGWPEWKNLWGVIGVKQVVPVLSKDICSIIANEIDMARNPLESNSRVQGKGNIIQLFHCSLGIIMSKGWPFERAFGCSESGLCINTNQDA